MRRVFLAALVCVVVLETCRAKILYQNCRGIADHPSVRVGNFHNLCILDHAFNGLTHPWLITKTNLDRVKFNKCVFTNSNRGVTNFTDSNFRNVQFNKCQFGSFNRNPMRLNNVVMRNVEFNECVFDKSAELKFAEFSLKNVTFKNCRFESDTLFEKGELQYVDFIGCSFKRSPTARTISGNDVVRFKELSMRSSGFLRSEFITPIVFQSVDGADLYFNHTSFNPFWCHSIPPGNRDPKFFSSFNDSVFQDATFRDKVVCDRTSWRGFTMFNGTFHSNADFSGSEIQDLYWNHVDMKKSFKGQCNTLDFSGSKIFREGFFNVTVACEMDFSDARIRILNMQKLRAEKSNFKGAVFAEQEYVGSRCCMKWCQSKKCRCNITSPSGSCKSAGYPVDFNAGWFCFPADSRVSTLHGSVRMDELEHGHRVAVGGGKHSDVFFFGHRSRWQYAPFIEIAHSGPESPLRISATHYLYANGRLTTAQKVRVGDSLKSVDGRALTVTKITHTMRHGLYAPTSLHGDLIVDGVTVSSYTSAVHPRLAHFLLHPLRLMYRAGLGRVVRQFNVFEGRSWEHIPRTIGIPQGPEVVEL